MRRSCSGMRVGLLALGVLAPGCFDFDFDPGDASTGGGPGSSASGSASGSVSGSSATSTGGASVCGDGVVDTGEQCDDHNRADGDGCDGACREEPTSTSTGSVGGGGAGTTSGAGGEGGADPCPGVDLLTDPDNCGACGFSCGTEACVDGRCGQSLALLDLGYIKSVLVVGDTLYVVQRDGAEGDVDAYAGTVRTVPIDFDDTTVPGLNAPVINAVGSLALGTTGARRVYFTGQSFTTSDSVFHPNPNVYACDVSGCDDVALDDVAVQINGVAAAGTTLYALDITGNRLLEATIDAVSGVPNPATTARVTQLQDDAIADGIIGLRYLASPPRLFWSTYDADDSSDGCIFRVEVAMLPVTSELPCYTDLFSAQGFAVASDGTMYAQDVDFGAGRQRVLEIAPNGALVGVFAEDATSPRDVDDERVFVTDSATHAIRALVRASGEEAGRTEEYPSAPFPYTMDVSHRDYVFYSVGNTLHRWPKPKT